MNVNSIKKTAIMALGLSLFSASSQAAIQTWQAVGYAPENSTAFGQPAPGSQVVINYQIDDHTPANIWEGDHTYWELVTSLSINGQTYSQSSNLSDYGGGSLIGLNSGISSDQNQPLNFISFYTGTGNPQDRSLIGLLNSLSSSTSDELNLRMDYTGSGSILLNNVTFSEVPIPGAAPLLLSSLGMLAIARRRQQAGHAHR